MRGDLQHGPEHRAEHPVLPAGQHPHHRLLAQLVLGNLLGRCHRSTNPAWSGRRTEPTTAGCDEIFIDKTLGKLARRPDTSLHLHRR